MGDRANVVIKEVGGGQVVLYTHWDASSLPETVKKALARRQRWDDESYLARIIFSEMIKDDIASETGYGIGSVVGDGADKLIEISIEAQTVSVYGKPAMSFEAFITAKT
jgi:hypothetical protein